MSLPRTTSSVWVQLAVWVSSCCQPGCCLHPLCGRKKSLLNYCREQKKWISGPFCSLMQLQLLLKVRVLFFLYTSLAAGDQWLTLHQLSQPAACKARAVGLEPLAGCCFWAGSARAPAMSGQAVLSNLGWARMPWFRVPVSFRAVCSQLPGSEHGCSCGEI